MMTNKRRDEQVSDDHKRLLQCDYEPVSEALDTESPWAPRSFTRRLYWFIKNIPRRALIFLAGVLMLLYFVLTWETEVPDPPPAMAVMLMSLSNSRVIDVVLLWNSPGIDPPSNLLGTCARIIPQVKNSMNNRWQFTDYKPGVQAVLVVDDDMKVTQRGLNNHWCVFNRNPHRLVGSALRAVGSDGKYRYSVSRDGSFVEPPWTVHPQHFLNYQKSEYTDMRDYVDSQAAHCDDVLMNRVVFESSGVTQTCIDSSSSDLIQSKLTKSADALSKQKNRRKLRAQCTTHIHSFMSVVSKIPDCSESCRELVLVKAMKDLWNRMRGLRSFELGRHSMVIQLDVNSTIG